MSFGLLLAAVLLAVSTSQSPIVLPDPSTGDVNGLSGVLYWPAAPTGRGQDVQPLAAADGCEVHLVPHDAPERELRYTCGKWFAPPAGKYNYWLETADAMTPAQNILVYTASPFRGRGLAAVIPVASAGRVAIPPGQKLPATEDLRFLLTNATNAWQEQPWVFYRRYHGSAVLMPEGNVIAARFDRKSNEAIALTRPMRIERGRTAIGWPSPPRASDVLVVLSKPAKLQVSKKPVSAHLRLNDRDADVLVNGADAIVGVWYGVDAPRGAISLRSDGAFWRPREIRLTPGKVTTVRSAVDPLPAASVSINVPATAKLPEMFLDVARPGGNDGIRRVEVGAGVHDLEELPAELLRLTLKIGDWKVAQTIDLSSGERANVAFDLEPITVAGTVFYGDDPVPGEIAFHNGGEWVAVQTDERGRYETTLWWPDVQTARVTLAGRAIPPFLDTFREIFESGRVDFHVPRTDYRVKVTDAKSGTPVVGALVIAGSVASEAGRQSAQHVTTDERGEASLPPLRSGELVVEATAAGYARSEPVRRVVDAEHHQIDIELIPLAMAGSLRLTLANGAPAAQADIWAFDPGMQPVWRGTASGEGALDLHAVARRIDYPWPDRVKP